jgi:cystathionine gamma-synthase
MRRGTVAVRGYRNVDPYGSLHPPIYQTAVFRMEGEAAKSDRGFDLKYSREENPTLRPLEEVVAKLEGGLTPSPLTAAWRLSRRFSSRL